MVPGTPFLSLVLPAYNIAASIGENLRVVIGALEALERPFEVICVCDGSTDGTHVAAAAVADPRLRVLRFDVNRGKGEAVLHGVAHARGQLIGWLDADLDLAPDVIVHAARRFDDAPIDAVVGSKRHPDSQVDYPWVRRVYSAGFQLLVRLLFRINVRDTQVGAKLLRREVLDTVAPLVLVKRYAFDLEILAAGAGFGFDRVEEVPIRLAYRFSGTGVNWRAIGRTFRDTLAIAYRIHVKHWYVRRYAALHRQRLDEGRPVLPGAPASGVVIPPEERVTLPDAPPVTAPRG
jgi:glycosyltransferase involved in cell wall biosynthesis